MTKSSISGPGIQSWYGNIAKTCVINEIVSRFANKVVLGFGARSGGGWAGTLHHHPQITAHPGDNSILWREMNSRTLELRRTNKSIDAEDSPDLADAANGEDA
jgi:hypothetical protein